MANSIWQCGRFELPLQKPLVMGIVNLTPDSFSDGGDYSSHTSLALKHAEDLLKSGADILDIGGESTRPGSDQISTTTEWQRIEPVLTELVKWNVPISLDTRCTEVMQRALDSGVADIINDVAALSDDGAVSLLAAHQRIGICLMHMQGEPKTMQHQPYYENVVEEVVSFLNQRVVACENAGISRMRLMVDPGIGFGKNLMHNLELMRHLRYLSEKTGLPLLLGVSRKRMIAELTGEADPKQRMMGSVAAALAGVVQGAAVVRVHDVKATVDALKVWQAVME